jgi:uncharacterized protein (UPF0248 family)
MEERHISFLDENDQKINGWFEIVEQNTSYITFKTGNNTLTIPIHRILKIKKRGVE